MDMFVVQGGQPLTGRVTVSGAKNAALPIMAATLLSEGPTCLEQVPDLVDVRTLATLLQSLGMSVVRQPSANVPSGNNRPSTGGPHFAPSRGAVSTPLTLEVVDSQPCVAEYDLVRRMRASVCVLGPLLARRGRACVSLPGGCNIGDRPVDLHLKGLAALGAEIRVERGYIFAEARRLKGAQIYLGGAFGSTVTGTCNVMMAATLAEGVTTIEAAACEPEVVDLGEFLNKMGARITGLGTPFLRIEGVDALTGVDHAIIPDRIEAATLMIGAAITRGDVWLDGVRTEHMTAVLETLREIGVRMQVSGDSLRVWTDGPLRPADCIMLPYPGIPTDVQAQFMALLATIPGISIITDKVFPDRFMHAAELARMGARVRREGPSAILSGQGKLSGASIMASDLRASAALVLAALAAAGETVIHRIYHLDRGYERLEDKLNHLGAAVRRVVDVPENLPASLALRDLDLVPVIDNATTPMQHPKWTRRAGSGKPLDDAA